MPAINLPSINITENDFKSKETMDQILDTLQKYRKELNFLLMNLDVDNMPSIGGLIGDIQGDYSLISQTVEGIIMQVGDIEGNVSSLQIQADSITAQVSNIQGDVSALQVQAEGIIADVRNNKGDIANLLITAEGLQTQVTNDRTYVNEQVGIIDGRFTTMQTTISNQFSQVTQRADSIESTVGSLSTTVTNHYNILTGELEDVTTDVSYNYSQIRQLDNEISLIVGFDDVTGKQIASKIVASPTAIDLISENIHLEADQIDLTGLTTIYSPDGTGYARMGSGYGDFTLYGGGNVFFKVYNSVGGMDIYSYDKKLLSYHGGTEIVNFSTEVEFNRWVEFANPVTFQQPAYFEHRVEFEDDSDVRGIVACYYPSNWFYMDYGGGTYINVRDQDGDTVGRLYLE